MNASPAFEQAFERARQLHARGSLRRAERVLQELLAGGEERESVLRALAELYLVARRTDDAIAALRALTREVPDRLFYYARLASLLDGLGRTDEAIAEYRRLLARRPELADAHYNLAKLHRKEKRYREAVAAYDEAIRLGIDRVEDVYLDLGVVRAEQHDVAGAVKMLDRALAIRPGYIPALFNRGGLHEEAGEKAQATECYRHILSLEPGHPGALARLVYADRVTDADDPLLDALAAAIDGAEDPEAREELLFARGKALDDLERFEEAFVAYRAANELGRRRTPPYQPPATEAAVGRLVQGFSREWIESRASGSAAAPIFICGMFRSGSTLLEQILATHPGVTAGGELDYWPWLVGRRLSPYPHRALEATRDELRRLGDDYLALLHDAFGDAGNVTDKRPDNFLYLGLVRAAFPSARIVYTKRDAADNCLSIWFQQLGRLAYATDLEHVAHYYVQHERLMQHWQATFPENLFTVDYDHLVRSPEPVVRSVLEFLGLEWDERCLDFRNAERPVRTASLWQVREALHERSSGRWKHYAPCLAGLKGPWAS